MSKKPQDLLEFLRRSSGDSEPVSAAPAREKQPPRESAPRMLVLRRSQLVVAVTAIGLFVILAFVVGLIVGEGSEAPAAPVAKTGVWVIRAISFHDTDAGRESARMVRQQLKERQIDDVTLHTLRSDNTLVVSVGSWLSDPRKDDRATTLLSRIRSWPDDLGKQPFHDAQFWQIQR